jgi:hypothetical protein
MTQKKHKSFRYFIRTLSIVVGLVLIWRGIWLILDDIDAWLFGGHSYITGLLGMAIGILLLYLPDRDLKEIEKL